jgi:hypothetical protein
VGGINFIDPFGGAKINLLPARYRSLVIFVCQLMLKLCLATLPNKNARLSPGNKLICGEGGT